jgi:hypothetical protein
LPQRAAVDLSHDRIGGARSVSLIEGAEKVLRCRVAAGVYEPAMRTVGSGVGRSLRVVSGLPRLPRADEAVIPTDKLVGYALNPEHPRGRHKARVFAAALGIRQTDSRYLREQLLDGVVGAPVRATRITPFSVLYEVVVSVDGLNGARSPVATIWLVAGDHPPRLVSPGRTSRERLPQSLCDGCSAT